GAETLLLFNLMQKNAVNENARRNQYVIMAPTIHCAEIFQLKTENVTRASVAGEREFGDARLNYTSLYLEWFDHWLKGLDNAALRRPRVEVYVMGRNQW